VSRNLRGRLARLEAQRNADVPTPPRIWDAFADPALDDRVPDLSELAEDCNMARKEAWMNTPVGRALREQRTRLGMDDLEGSDGFDVLEEVIRLAAIPTPADGASGTDDK
jgi:hypothetical protein